MQPSNSNSQVLGPDGCIYGRMCRCRRVRRVKQLALQQGNSRGGRIPKNRFQPLTRSSRTYREAILSTGTSTCDESYYDRCGHMACSKSQARSWDRKQTEIRRARHILSAQDRCGHLRLSAGKAESPCMGERTGSEGLQANVQEVLVLALLLAAFLPPCLCLPCAPAQQKFTHSSFPPSVPSSLAL